MHKSRSGLLWQTVFVVAIVVVVVVVGVVDVAVVVAKRLKRLCKYLLHLSLTRFLLLAYLLIMGWIPKKRILMDLYEPDIFLIYQIHSTKCEQMAIAVFLKTQ